MIIYQILFINLLYNLLKYKNIFLKINFNKLILIILKYILFQYLNHLIILLILCINCLILNLHFYLVNHQNLKLTFILLTIVKFLKKIHHKILYLHINISLHLK